MSQDVFDSINPSTTSGTQLATILDDFKNALMSGLSGTSRPTELTAGGTWVDTTDEVALDQWAVKLYDGTNDIEIFRIDLINGSIIPAIQTDELEIKKISADAVGAVLSLVKNRIASNGQVQVSDVIGEIDFVGRDSSSNNPVAARIRAIASNNMTSSAQGAYVVIESIDTGTTTLVEQMRIKDGKVGIGITSPDSALHVRSTTGIKSSRSSDDANGAKFILAKSRVTGTGATQSSDVLGSIDILGLDDASAEFTGASISVSATQAHTASNRGTKITISNTKLSASSAVSFLEITDYVEVVEMLLVNSEKLAAQDIATAASITAMNADKYIANFTGSTTTSVHGISATGKSKVIVLHNGSSATVTVKHQSTTDGTAANRIKLPGSADIAIAPDGTLELFYSTTDSRWKLRTGDTGGAGSVTTLASGGTGKNLTAVAGGIVYSDADSFEILSAGTAEQWLICKGSSAPAWGNTVTTGKTIDGSANEVQLTVQGHSTQTSDIFLVERSGGTDLLQVTDTRGTKIRGTTDADNAPTGYIGEELRSSVTSATSVGTAGDYFDGTTLALTAGNWELSAVAYIDRNGATSFTNARLGIGTASGNSDAGITFGDNGVIHQMNSGNFEAVHLCIPAWKLLLGGAATYRLKLLTGYSGGTPVFRCRLSAKRVF